MKIVIAPDKFKGCLSAPRVSEFIASGIMRAAPDAGIDRCPLADGGEGTVAAMVAATHGRIETRRVTGPLPEMKVDAEFGVLGDGRTAVVEMSAASGLALLKSEDRNPLNTTTFGTGELLDAAARLGVERIILGIGGSATVDAGIGCAQACGLPVILAGGEAVSPTEPLCGRDIESVVLIKHGRGSAIELSRGRFDGAHRGRFDGVHREPVRITVACDVNNPLFGPNGAAFIFGPQKGATPGQVEWLDAALRGLAIRTGKLAEAEAPGAGAAGGLGFGMLAWFGATLEPGARIVIEATRLRDRLRGADLCITGEGRLDAGSLAGKAPIAVARLSREMNVPCVAIVGSTGPGAELAIHEGITRCIALDQLAPAGADPFSRAPELLANAAEAIVAEMR